MLYIGFSLFQEWQMATKKKAKTQICQLLSILNGNKNNYPRISPEGSKRAVKINNNKFLKL